MNKDQRRYLDGLILKCKRRADAIYNKMENKDPTVEKLQKQISMLDQQVQDLCRDRDAVYEDRRERARQRYTELHESFLFGDAGDCLSAAKAWKDELDELEKIVG